MAALKNIGNIQIFAEIHNGAINTVYKGYQTSLQRFVLVKVLQPQFTVDTELVTRFTEEARFVAKIQHPNVVAIYESGELDNQHYFAAEFIEGFDLRQVLTKKKLPPELAFYILAETAKGLKAAHDKDILHQDIKPSNILLSHEGEVKLTDFGMAGLLGNADDTAPTPSGGTWQYFSPEQILGEKPDKRSDIFSLGSTFFEMLTGVPAFRGEKGGEFFEAIINQDPLPFLRGRRDIPDALARLCEKMLEKNKKNRHQNGTELISELNKIQDTLQLEIDASDLKSYLDEPVKYQPFDFNAKILQPEKQTSPTQKRKKSNFRTVAFFSFPVLLVAVYVIFLSPTFETAKRRDIVENKDTTFSVPVDSGRTVQPSQPETMIEQSTKAESTKGSPMQIPEKDEPTRPMEKEEKQETLKNEIVGTGYLNISITPWAQVFIDGNSIGTTPFNRNFALPEGEHTIKVINPEFPIVEKQIQITANTTSSFETSLWAEICELNLDISPWAKVYIDGVYKDTIPPQQRAIVLFPGKRKLLLEHPVLGRWETEIEAKAGQALNLQFNLNTLLMK